jgi:hypothetical protein
MMSSTGRIAALMLATCLLATPVAAQLAGPRPGSGLSPGGLALPPSVTGSSGLGVSGANRSSSTLSDPRLGTSPTSPSPGIGASPGFGTGPGAGSTPGSGLSGPRGVGLPGTPAGSSAPNSIFLERDRATSLGQSPGATGTLGTSGVTDPQAAPTSGLGLGTGGLGTGGASAPGGSRMPPVGGVPGVNSFDAVPSPRATQGTDRFGTSGAGTAPTGSLPSR